MEGSLAQGTAVPSPYTYPPAPHVRRHGPAGWDNYQYYRPWIRDEFAFRCVYCLDRERWRDMRGAFHIDHWQPQARRPDLGHDYANLLYLCPACNSLKRASILPDPCAVALGDSLRVHPDGRIEALNEAGECLIETLALDSPHARDRRRLILGTLLSLAATNSPELVEWLRFPDDLPNLTTPPKPPSNSKPQGVLDSHYERRSRKELPSTY